MKKLFIVSIAAMLAVSALACYKIADNSNDHEQNVENTNVPNISEVKPDDNASEGLTGELEPGAFKVFKNTKGFKVDGISLMSDHTGLPGGINNLEPSLDRVRTVFELDENVYYTLDYEYGNAEAKLGLWIFSHRPLSEYNNIAELGGELFFAEYELPYENYPMPMEDCFKLESPISQSGLYDMIFTLDNKVIGGTILNILDIGALDGMTDEEIMSMIAVG